MRWLLTALWAGLSAAGTLRVSDLKTLASIDDVPISKGNPFFDDQSLPLHTPVPPNLFSQLMNAGCDKAWRRQQHSTTSLDDACTAMLKPFILSSPGSILGVYNAFITASEACLLNVAHCEILPSAICIYEECGAVPYAFMTSEKLLKFDTPEHGYVDLSSTTWATLPPPIFDPAPGASLDNLRVMSAKGAKAPQAFIAHALGVWAYAVAGGGANSTVAANELAFKHSMEYFLFLGHHAKQNDKAEAVFQSCK